MSSLTLTQKWLQENISQYKNFNRLYIDIDISLNKYPSLRPKSDIYSQFIIIIIYSYLLLLSLR